MEGLIRRAFKSKWPDQAFAVLLACNPHNMIIEDFHPDVRKQAIKYENNMNLKYS